MSVESPRAHPVAADLLRWYDRHARELPWRIPPGSQETADPYRVWLSEIMLQQTTVAAVRDRFMRFLDRWPDVAALAAAPQEAVMAEWAGLGYYARARNLHACAKAVVAAGGAFPATEAGLRALPGVGAYTAAAIAAIAFDAPATVVDANVERVVARLGAISEPLPQARTAIRALAETLTPRHRAGDFAQAMMDLGASVCTVKAPQCLICPLRADCRGYAAGIAAALPVKPVKQAKPERRGWAYWIERNAAIWLVRRPGKGLLGGMRALPGSDWQTEQPQLPGRARSMNVRIRHVFTHFALDLELAALDEPAGEGQFWPLADIAAAGLPTLYRKAVAAALEQR